MDKILHDIAGFTARFDLASVPDDVRAVAVQRVVDSVGCGVGGWDGTAPAAARTVTPPVPKGLGAGRLLCEPRTTTAEAAAFINTAALRYLDFNDTYPGGHPSDMIGGLLAVAGAVGASGHDLVAATIIAYEVNTRLSTSVHLMDRAIDQGFGVGLGTAAGTSHLLGLDDQATAHAVAITAVAGVPLRASRAGQLSHWKGAATAVAVRNGVFAALMASQGVTGPERPFDGRHGLWELLGRSVEVDPLPTDGHGYRITATRLKYWPVAYNMQPAIWAAKGLHGDVRPADITSATLFTDAFAKHESGSEPEKWTPTSRETADHSLPYVVAWTLLHGGVDARSFTSEAIASPDVHELMGKVDVVVDDDIEAAWPGTIQARLVVTDGAGREHVSEAVNPRGHELNPLSDDDVEEKFVALASPRLGAAAAREAAQLWRDLPRHSSLDECFESVELTS